MNPIKRILRRLRPQVIPIVQIVVSENKYIHTLCSNTGVQVGSADYFGSEVTFTSESLIVKKYHKGIDCSFIDNLVSLPGVSFSSLVEQATMEIAFPSRLAVQSADGEEKSPLHRMLELVLLRAPQVFSTYDRDWFLTQVENFSQICTWSAKCTTITDYIAVTQLAYRLFTGKPSGIWIRDKVEAMVLSTVQSVDFGDVLKTLRQAFDATSTVTESPLVKKLTSLYSFLLTQGFLERFGISITDEEYSKLEQRALVGAFSSKKAFFMCVLDTVLFVSERLYEFRRTGDMSGLLHSEDKYLQWYKEADRISNLAPFTGNLEAHGTSYFSFLSDLDGAIEKGESYCKYMSATAGVSNKAMRSKLSALQLLKNTEITRKSASQERTAPMGVLVAGSSSVAKSAFTKIIFNYFGGLFELERGDEYRYVRNPLEVHWNGFTSSKWCIQLDDVAFMHPSKCNEVDPSTKEIITIGNNVPTSPPQAGLEDKGKTPVLSKLLIATTNCITLNAREYFWCPLAVRRRLPYVVSVTPKNEYLHANGQFIDPAKLECEEGKFPDFWVITVSKLVPVSDGVRDDATLEEVAVFTDINKFLQHFGKACMEHDKNQKKAMSKNDDMKSVVVCKTCLAPLPHSTCMDVQFLDYNPFSVCAWWLIEYIATMRFNMWLMNKAIQYRYLRTISLYFANWFYGDNMAMRFFARAMEATQSKKMARAIMCISVIGLVFSTYYFLTQGKSKEEESKDTSYKGRYRRTTTTTTEYVEDRTEGEVREETSSSSTTKDVVCISAGLPQQDLRTKVGEIAKDGECDPSETEVQGNVHGTTEDQLLKEERSNVWYNPTIELSSFEVPVPSASLAGLSMEGIRDLFAKNLVLLDIRVDGELSKRSMRGVFIGGQRCLTNAHAFKKTGSNYTVTIIRDGVSEGISSNIVIRLKRSNIAFGESDACIFEVFSLPPFKDITKYWNTSDFAPTSGVELMRNPDGKIEHNPLFALQPLVALPVPELGMDLDVYYGHSTRVTEVGMCGALCVATTPRGPIIIGIHVLGKEHTVGILKLKLGDIRDLLKNAAILDRPSVQGGGSPMLSCASKQRHLTPLHFKSMFRYIEQGNVHLYGSFSGYRPRQKSKVCLTPLHEKVVAHFGRPIGHGRPAMSGWEPWRKNVIDMVKPKVIYDRDILKKCVDGYVADVLRGLPPGWESELVELSDMAAVNGLPGVMYIDGITRTTSMGAPWGCPKKKFLEDCVSDKYPQGVTFGPEIWERVRAIEALYKEGKRCYAIYTGKLKDEATPLAKCMDKKTRLFSVSPVDFNIVVRKKLLSFVRLVQKNKFVFEAAPGVVTQSSEWGDLYRYLTQFGQHRMVGGDYRKYDKGMVADFILSAFDVIRKIHCFAGFSEEELLTIMCIANDIAFPVTDVNGDLVEFFGTNPSGHVLTVIINSIVNSLYMRYCYCVLNPESEVHTFKKHVSLMTYGDDNIMGVSVSAPWFNHTGIQKALLTIGVEYTMADKEAESVPFINIKECSFLKRSWSWNEEVGDWLAPLEEDSIFKSLTVWVPSGTIDCFAQTAAVVTSAVNEYFFYGREKFEEKREFLMGLLGEEPYSLYVRESTFPTFDELVERFHRASLRPVAVIRDNSDETELSLSS